MIWNSVAASVSLSAEVGSSMMITLTCRETVLAISTICCSATERVRTMAVGDRSSLRWLRIALRLRQHLAAVEEDRRARFTPDEDVLHHRQVGHQVEFLVDDGDAQFLRLVRIGDVDGPALQEDLAFVQAVDAGEDLHQRRFAGAVLADEAEDFARADVQADVVQRADAGKGFADVIHPQQGVRSVHICGAFLSVGAFGGAVIGSCCWNAPMGRCEYIIGQGAVNSVGTGKPTRAPSLQSRGRMRPAQEAQVVKCEMYEARASRGDWPLAAGAAGGATDDAGAAAAAERGAGRAADLYQARRPDRARLWRQQDADAGVQPGRRAGEGRGYDCYGHGRTVQLLAADRGGMRQVGTGVSSCAAAGTGHRPAGDPGQPSVGPVLRCARDRAVRQERDAQQAAIQAKATALRGAARNVYVPRQADTVDLDAIVYAETALEIVEQCRSLGVAPGICTPRRIDTTQAGLVLGLNYLQQRHACTRVVPVQRHPRAA